MSPQILTLERLIERHDQLMAEALEFARLHQQRLGAANEVAAMIEMLRQPEELPPDIPGHPQH